MREEVVLDPGCEASLRRAASEESLSSSLPSCGLLVGRRVAGEGTLVLRTVRLPGVEEGDGGSAAAARAVRNVVLALPGGVGAVGVYAVSSEGDEGSAALERVAIAVEVAAGEEWAMGGVKGSGTIGGPPALVLMRVQRDGSPEAVEVREGGSGKAPTTWAVSPAPLAQRFRLFRMPYWLTLSGHELAWLGGVHDADGPVLAIPPPCLANKPLGAGLVRVDRDAFLRLPVLQHEEEGAPGCGLCVKDLAPRARSEVEEEEEDHEGGENPGRGKLLKPLPDHWVDHLLPAPATRVDRGRVEQRRGGGVRLATFLDGALELFALLHESEALVRLVPALEEDYRRSMRARLRDVRAVDDPLPNPVYKGSGSEAPAIRAELAAHPLGHKRYVLPRRLVYALGDCEPGEVGPRLWASRYMHEREEAAALEGAPGWEGDQGCSPCHLTERFTRKINPWDVEPVYDDNTFTGEIPYIMPVPKWCSIQ